MNPRHIHSYQISKSSNNTPGLIITTQFYINKNCLRESNENKKVFVVSFFLICLFPVLLIAQDISVHKFIGKKKADVIKKYGKPVHQDNSNPDMMCMFYQTKTSRMIFVSDREAIYQSEASANYNSEAAARSIVDQFILGSVEEGFAVDTISANDFHLFKSGVKADLQLSENKITKKFDVNIKARRSED